MGVLAAKVTVLLVQAKKLNPPFNNGTMTKLAKLAKDIADFEAKFDLAKKAAETAQKAEAAAKKECDEAHKAAKDIVDDIKTSPANSPAGAILKDLKAVVEGLNKKVLGLK